MKAQWNRNQRSVARGIWVAAGICTGLALSIAAGVAFGADTITDSSQADQVLLERAKVAKQIVVEGQPGSLQAEQEKAALDRAQQGYQAMDASRAAAAERRANFEAAKQEAARIQADRQQRYWESTMNMEALLARQQQIEDTRQKNLQAAQQRDLKDWNVVGQSTDAGFKAQEEREKIRQENLRRYQASLQSGWAAVRPQEGLTVQQQIDMDRQVREQQLLQHNLGYWNNVMSQSDEGRRQQEAVMEANRQNQIQHLSERVKEWNTIDQGKDDSLREQAARDQVRQANALRDEQQNIEQYRASRVGSQVVPTPINVTGVGGLGAPGSAAAAAGAPAGAPAANAPAAAAPSMDAASDNGLAMPPAAK